MIIEITTVDAISLVATALSLGGNWFVAKTIPVQQRTGYYIWLVSNVIWVSYFATLEQYGPMLLFMAYLAITVKAIIDRLDQLGT
jgi:hypothetical protein